MTKYILNSGGAKNHPEKEIRFNREIVKGLGDNPCVLFCFFASPRDRWEEKFHSYSKRFLESMDSGVVPKFDLAFPDSFVDQIKNSDAIVIYGGDDNLLLFYFKNYDLPAVWQGKVVAGSSAGSDILVKYFWTCDWRQTKEGLGILPIKFIPEYKSEYGKDDPRGSIDWEVACDELKNYKEDLPIHALEEGNYVVFEV